MVLILWYSMLLSTRNVKNRKNRFSVNSQNLLYTIFCEYTVNPLSLLWTWCTATCPGSAGQYQNLPQTASCDIGCLLADILPYIDYNTRITNDITRAHTYLKFTQYHWQHQRWKCLEWRETQEEIYNIKKNIKKEKKVEQNVNPKENFVSSRDKTKSKHRTNTF